LRRKSMRITAAALICLALPVLAIAMGPRPGDQPHGTGKPESPLTLSIEPAGPVVSGATVQMTVRLDSSVSAADVELKVRAVGGAEPAGGTWSWTGPVERGVPLSFPITVILPNKGGGLKAKALLRVSKVDRASYGARASFSFGRDAGPGPETAPPGAETSPATESKGRAVKEYRAP